MSVDRRGSNAARTFPIREVVILATSQAHLFHLVAVTMTLQSRERLKSSANEDIAFSNDVSAQAAHSSTPYKS